MQSTLDDTISLWQSMQALFSEGGWGPLDGTDGTSESACAAAKARDPQMRLIPESRTRTTRTRWSTFALPFIGRLPPFFTCNGSDESPAHPLNTQNKYFMGLTAAARANKTRIYSCTISRTLSISGINNLTKLNKNPQQIDSKFLNLMLPFRLPCKVRWHFDYICNL